MSKKIKLSTEQIAELKELIEIQQGSARELARVQAILMYEKGMDIALIYEIVGIKRSAIFKWRSRFCKGGAVALHDKEKSKPKSLLTRGQIAEIIKVLKTENPTAFGYRTEFWNTDILGKLIKLHYNVEYKAKKRLYLLFEKASFTYHKPGQQYRKRNQDVIDRWVELNTPLIKKHIADPETIVITGDEMVLSTQTTFQKVWIPVNTYPKVDVSNNRANRSVYGFLNIKNGACHAFKTEHQNSTITCSVLDQLCALYAEKHIVLIWDNAPWHRSEEVKKWLSSTKYHITLIAFPPYAPELNPQEHVWKTGRSNISHNKFIENIDTATNDFVHYLNKTSFAYDLLDLVHA